MAVNYHTWQPATIHGIPLPNMAAGYHISHPTTIYGILLQLLMLETQKRDTAVSVQDGGEHHPTRHRGIHGSAAEGPSEMTAAFLGDGCRYAQVS